MNTSLTPEQRFWAKVDQRGPNDCWPWLGEVNHGGYGLFQFSQTRRNVRAHRFVLGLISVESANVIVRHHCDNPPCCNPAHLTTGTKQQNSQDMVDRGRQARGSRVQSSRLTEQQVQQILRRLPQGESYRALAREFEISPTEISAIARGRQWKHVQVEGGREQLLAGRRNDRRCNKRLTEADVRVIRDRIAAGQTYSSLATEFGVHATTVSLIARQKIWANVRTDRREKKEQQP